MVEMDGLNLCLKKGHSTISLTLSHGREIEEFWQNLSGGKISDLKEYTYAWKGNDLRMYQLPSRHSGETLDFLSPARDIKFIVNNIGGSIMEPIEDGDKYGPKNVVNLSFLRLVGISSETPITISMNNTIPMSKLMLEQMWLGIQAGVTGFYKQYINPVEMKLRLVVTRDM